MSDKRKFSSSLYPTRGSNRPHTINTAIRPTSTPLQAPLSPSSLEKRMIVLERDMASFKN